MSQVFTTGQVAKICKVSTATVTKWIDSGQLKGYRIPGSQYRRVPRHRLIQFLKSNGLSSGELISSVTYLGRDEDLPNRLSKLFAEKGLEVISWSPENSFDLGLRLGGQEALALMIDLQGYAKGFYQPTLNRLLSSETWQGIVLLPDHNEIDVGGIETLARPFDPEYLYRRMCTLIGM